MSEYTLPTPKAVPAAASAKKVALTDATTVYELYRVCERTSDRARGQLVPDGSLTSCARPLRMPHMLGLCLGRTRET